MAGLDKIALAAALAKLAQTAAKTKELKNIVKRVKDTLISKPPKTKQIPKGKIFQRPKGVPKEWVKKPSKSGEGAKYVDPKNSGTYVRIQKADPNECVMALYDDTGLDDYLYKKTIFDKDADYALKELDHMVMAIPDDVDERELIDSPEMEAIRKKAAEALRLVRASTYEGSTVEIVEE